MAKQKLIHLHGTNPFTDEHKDLIGLGEIVVTHAPTAAATELVVKTEDANKNAMLVRIPSLTKVQNVAATAVSGEAALREAKDTELDGKISAMDTAYKAADSALQEAVNAKVAQSEYNTKVGELAAEDVRIAGLVATEQAAREAADTELDAAMIKTIVVENTEINKIKATASTNTVTFNFDEMVIDCGTYDSAE